jgi:hypothetical protein
MSPDFDQNAVALRLTRKARASGTKRHAFMLQPCIAEYLADVVRMTGNHHNLWEEAIGTCVGGEADKVDRSCEHLSSAKQGDEILAQ